MRKHRRVTRAQARRAAAIPASVDESLGLYSKIAHLKSRIEKLAESTVKSEERLQDIEIHLNLLTRLITTLCVEKFGMRIGVLKRLIKRIEKEAIRDSQILHLESLYKLPVPEKKSGAPPPPSKNDPWEDIS